MTDFKSIFLNLLEAETVSAEDTTADHEDSGEGEAFDKSLDAGSSAEDFDVEGMGDVPSVVDAFRDELIEQSSFLEKVKTRIIDPNNPQSFLNRIAKMHTIPEFEPLYAPLQRDLGAAALALAKVITQIETVATTAPHNRDRRREQDAASASISQKPY